MAFAANGGTIVTAGWDGTVRQWQAQSGKEIRRWEVPKADIGKSPIINPSRIREVVLSPDGKSIAALRNDLVVVVWDAASAKEVYRFGPLVTSTAFSPDGNLLAYAELASQGQYFTGIIHVLDLATGKELMKLPGHLTQVSSLAFAPDGKTLISRGSVLMGLRAGEPQETKYIRFWDLARGKERQIQLAESHIRGFTLSPDGRMLAATADAEPGNTIRLWETATGRLRGQVSADARYLSAVAFSPDGNTLACGDFDGRVWLWDAFYGKEVGKLQGHGGWVNSVVFSPDGKTLVSGSLDTTALVWDVSRFTQHGKTGELQLVDLESCWKDLGAEPAIAYRATGRLLSSPAAVVEFLRERLKPTPGEGQRIAQLIRDLDSDQFKTRDAAMTELAKLGEAAAPAMDNAITATATLELRQRLELLLGKLDGTGFPPETLRQMRAVEVLEHIGTPEAQTVLEGLAQGDAHVRLTQEAKAAVLRLKKR